MRPTQEQIAGTLKKRYQPDEDSIETITGLAQYFYDQGYNQGKAGGPAPAVLPDESGEWKEIDDEIHSALEGECLGDAARLLRLGRGVRKLVALLKKVKE